MKALTTSLKASPLLARVLPFVVFVVLTACQGSFGPESHFWLYLAKCVAGGWLVWLTWPLVSEMRWTISFQALFAGTLVFVICVSGEATRRSVMGAGGSGGATTMALFDIPPYRPSKSFCQKVDMTCASSP